MDRLDQLLFELQLAPADFVARFRELSKLPELVRVVDEPQPIDAWVPKRAIGDFATSVTVPFDRSTLGWDMVTSAGAVGAELFLSLERLPLGASLTRYRLEYASNTLVPVGGLLLELCAYHRVSSNTRVDASVALAVGIGGLTHQTLTVTPPAPVIALDGYERFLRVRCASSNAGGNLRVKACYLSYSYKRTAL